MEQTRWMLMKAIPDVEFSMVFICLLYSIN